MAFVLEWGRKLIIVDVKLSSAPKFVDTETLKLFLDEYPEIVAGIVVYTENKIKMLHEKIVAVPWTVLAGL